MSQVAKLFEGENDRVKFFTLMCGDEDEKVQRAAAGALAVLTVDNAVICKKIIEVKYCSDSFFLYKTI